MEALLRKSVSSPLDRRHSGHGNSHENVLAIGEAFFRNIASLTHETAPLDLVIIVVYMLGTLGVGWWFSRKQRNIAITSSQTTTRRGGANGFDRCDRNFDRHFYQRASVRVCGQRKRGGWQPYVSANCFWLSHRPVVIVLLFIPLYFKGELFHRLSGARSTVRRKSETHRRLVVLVTRSMPMGSGCF